MSMLIRICCGAWCLLGLSACEMNRFQTRSASPKVIQCSADALARCAPLVIDDVAQCPPDRPAGAGCAAAALKADAANRARYLECQQRQRAAADCLRTLQADGVLKAPPAVPASE